MDKHNTENIIEGSHLKRILRHGSLYMLSSVLVKASQAILLPIYAHYLSPEEYAEFSNLMAIGAIAGLVISFYIDYAYARLYFDTNKNVQQQNLLFSTLFIFLLVWGTASSIGIFFLVRAQTSALLSVPGFPHVFLACVIPLITQINTLASVHFRSQHRSGAVSTTMLAGFIATALTALILLCGYNQGSVSLLWGALAGVVTISIRYYYMLIREHIVGWRFSFPMLKEALIFSIGLLPMTASAWVSGHFDKLLITWFGSKAQSGIYSVAFELGRIIELLVMSLFMVYTPMIYAMLKEDARKHIARIEQFQSFYFHAIIGMAFGVSLFSPEIFQLLLNEKYHAGIGLVPIIAFAFVFGGARKLYATLIYYHKLTLLISLGGIMQALISFGINVLMIPTYGGEAAAWAKLISMFIVSIYFYLLCLKYEPLLLDFRALLISLSILAVCLGLLGFFMYVLKLSFWFLAGAKVGIMLLALYLTWRSRFGAELHRLLKQRKQGASLSSPAADRPNDTINPI